MAGEGLVSAGTGAAVGSAFGPVGTVIGGVVGGLASTIMAALSDGRELTAAELAYVQQKGGMDRVRAEALYEQSQQSGNIDYLKQQAAGLGPSMARAQAQMNANASAANQQSMLASAAPGNQALSARMAAQNSAKAQGSVNGQSAVARQQEMTGAQALLGQALQNTYANQAGLLGQQDQRRLDDATMYENSDGASPWTEGLNKRTLTPGDRRPPPGRRIG